MPDLYTPVDGQPWPLERFLRQAPAWSPSGVIGVPAIGFGNGACALSFAVAGSVITVQMAQGRVHARGVLYERTESQWVSGASGTQPTPGTAAYGLNTNTNARIDRLVIRRDPAALKAYPLILIGTPAASPVAPALTQVEAGVWDTPLFSWTLAGSSSTSISNIVDERRWIMPDAAVMTPQLFQGSTQVLPGTNGQFRCDYLARGEQMNIQSLQLDFGTGLNIPSGSLDVTLPLPAAPTRLGQRLPGQFFHGNGGAETIDAYVYILATGGSRGRLVVRKTPTAADQRYADMSMGTAAGAGVPQVSGKFGVENGSQLLVAGDYRVA
ncbi:hypothetical protein [Klenkia brasiliensis]|uniref:Uncharacterized protein n=1 Tax=Klenkia brasiliensis TaxID=333142 RepID=A0A1G7YEG8_9ACTN|nr:hypothetical protein [Klenkia brasiliensis]SDG94962.1 hypothetical protein SAMN05660324_3930 [Klenkia brasiliensis]